MFELVTLTGDKVRMSLLWMIQQPGLSSEKVSQPGGQRWEGAGLKVKPTVLGNCQSEQLECGTCGRKQSTGFISECVCVCIGGGGVKNIKHDILKFFFFVACRLTRSAERLHSLMAAALFQKLREHISKAAARHWATRLPAEPSDGAHCVALSRPRRLAALCQSGLSTTNVSSNRWDGNEKKSGKKWRNKVVLTFSKLLSGSTNLPKPTEDEHGGSTLQPLIISCGSYGAKYEKLFIYLGQKIISCSPPYWMLFFYYHYSCYFSTKKR